MTNQLRRRALLQFLAAASSGALTGCGTQTTDESVAGTRDGVANGPGQNKNVVILGGGLAGLCSAYELRKRGYTIVAILEAQARVGGRVLTLRNGLKHGQYAEAGATRIASTHNFTLSYADEFNLTLREFITSEPALYYLKGKAPFIHADGDAWPSSVLNFKPSELTLAADTLVGAYEDLAELGDPLQSDWPTGKALDYNAVGIQQYLKSRGASDDVLLLDRAINGTELPRDGALYWLMADVVDAAWNQTYAIAGGNDQLPKAFAASLGDLVKFESVVSAIEQDQHGVKVTFKHEGQKKTVTADLCVCAIPFTMLRKIAVTPAFSAAKAHVVNTVSMMPVGRCYLQTKSRFWNEQGIGGLKVARTDTHVERLWDMTQVQDGDSGILLSYMQADNGEAFGQVPNGAKVSYVKKGVAKFFPQIEDETTASLYKVWQDDPWVGGAWSYYKPGEMAEMFPAAKAPEGRIFFCGEHTSAWSGWMQGALESANRVVAEITG
jgi:monoamine oxidase